MVYQNFQLDEAATIINIPISQFGAHDKIVWLHTKDGNFSVGSAYHLKMERSNRHLGESLIQKKEEEFWNAVWKLNVQAK